MTLLAIVVLVCFVIWLADKHDRLRQLAKVMIIAAIIAAVVAGCLVGYAVYERSQLPNVQHKADLNCQKKYPGYTAEFVGPAAPLGVDCIAPADPKNPVTGFNILQDRQILPEQEIK